MRTDDSLPRSSNDLGANVRVLGKNNKEIGIMTLSEALKLAD
jgi:translation initiation factor IF-3